MRTINLIFLIAAFTTTTLFAQRPSEIRQQKEKEKENEQKAGGEEKLTPSQLRMKNKEKAAKEKIFGDDDADFAVSAIPDKWKNESAVIVCQKMVYNFLRNNQSLDMEETTRRKIKLNDKAAVTEFSEFYFTSTVNYGSTGSTLGVQIIKQDGSVVDVDLKNAVDADGDIPDVYQTYYYSVNYKKIAIPDLQPGDIIDYYYTSKSVNYFVGLKEYAFSPFIFTLSKTYPVMAQKFEFTMDRGFFINFNSYNGAPPLVEGEAGKDAHGRVRSTVKTFKLEDRDRGKTSRDIWNYSYVNSPTIKFQVIYATPAMWRENETMMKSSSCFLGEMGEAKSSVTEDEIQSVVSRRLDANNPTLYTDEMLTYIRKYHPKEKDPSKILRLAYYYMRYQLVHNYYRSYDRGGMLTDDKRFADGYVGVDPYKFTSIILEVCKRHKIKAEVFVAVPRYYGAIKNVLLVDELSVGIVADISGKKVFYFPFNNFSTPDLVNPDIQGTEAYSFVPTLIRSKKVLNSSKITIPASSYADNAIAYKLDVTLDDQFENIKAKRNSVFSGLCKKDMQSLALYSESYAMKDRKKYDPKYEDASELTRGNTKKIADAKQKKEEEIRERKEKHNEKLKDYVKDDFDVVTFDEYELISDGRTDETVNLEFNEKFTLKNLVNKAGKNYIFDIGKLIGSQLELDEKEKKRENDVYISFAKSFTNEITVNVPAGYSVEGLNDLNMSVNTESASFTSTAKLEGGKIIIKTTKSYKKHYDTKENWPKLLDALETAYKFTQKKVILKKA